MTSSFRNIPPSLLPTDPPASVRSDPWLLFQASFSRAFLTTLGLHGLSLVQTCTSHPAPGIGCSFWSERMSLLSPGVVSGSLLRLCFLRALPPGRGSCKSPAYEHRNWSPAALARLRDLKTQLSGVFICKMRIRYLACRVFTWMT